MRDAWILAGDQRLAGEAAAALSQLGLTPRRAAVNGSGRPRAHDGGSERLPHVVMVVPAAHEAAPTRACTQLRQDDGFAAVPVVLALDEQHLRPRLDISGADEVIVRPYSAAELGIRIERAQAQQSGGEHEVIQVGSLELNLATYQVTVGERPVEFAYMEYALLKFLVTHPRRVYSREALLSSVWGYEYYGGARTVDVHVRRVRSKLGPEHAHRLKTVRGVGYRFDL